MPDAPVLLKSLRSHFLGGRDAVAHGLPVLRRQVVGNGAARAVDMNGSYCAGQLYVQEYRLAEPRHPHPVLLWHGGGMSGAQWESTPDGRHGWLWRLLQSGYDVFVADAPERGRASWAMYPQIYDAAPIFRSKEEAWHLFRIGPAEGGATASVRLASGDVCALTGPARLARHGIDRVLEGSSRLIPGGGRLNLTLRIAR